MYQLIEVIGVPKWLYHKIWLIMRLTTVLLIACLMQVSAAGLAQKITLNERNAPLNAVLKAIGKQSGYAVYFDGKGPVKSKKVTVMVKEVSVEEALNEAFKGLDFTYKIESKTIAVKPKEEPSFVEKIIERFQAIDVTGKVVNEKGVALAGATVKVKGTNRSTSTDGEGLFTLNSLAEDAVLQISYLGYKSREVKASQIANTNIQLELEINNLEEVAINTGYQRIKPERFVGSATVIDSAILQRQVGRNLMDRLDGTANGLLFDKANNNGTLKFQLRGVSTLNIDADINGLSSQNPLIILDDFPFAGDINTINPNDIESVSILKDALAASIWGARAGNGVIVIKTKRAKKDGRFTAEFNTNLSISAKPNLNHFPRMSSSEYIDVEQFLFDKGYYDIYLMYPQYFKTTPVADILDKKRKGTLSEEAANLQLDALRNHDVREDLDKYVYRNAINRQSYLKLSQGTQLLNYTLSAGLDNNISGQKGPGKNDRFTLNTNAMFKPARFLDVYAGISYINEKNRLDNSYGSNLLPYTRLADEQGNPLAIPYKLNVEYLETLPKDRLLDWQYRPLDELQARNSSVTNNRLQLNFGVTARLTSWLNWDVRYQHVNQFLETRAMQPVDAYDARDMINTFTNPSTFIREIPVGGILDLSDSKTISNHIRTQLNIYKNWNDLHDFNALVAAEGSKTSFVKDGSRMYGYDENTSAHASSIDYKNGLPTWDGSSSKIPPYLGNIPMKISNLVSVLANASYTYDRRYGVYASARRDGTNLIGVNTNNKFKPLWSAGVRWNISKEDFFKVPAVSNLALRATYGYAGNVNNSVSALNLISYSSALNPWGQPQANASLSTNPDLRWEEVRTINLGLDFGFFDNRISGNLEWWSKKSKDVVSNFPLDPTLGVENLPKNGANLSGKGLDFSLNLQNLRGKFTWQTGINLNYAKTVVTKYYNNAKFIPLGFGNREGDVYNAYYAYRWAGLDPQNGDPRGYVGDEISKNYYDIFNDDFKNQAYIGSSIPNYFGNIVNTFSYAGLSLSANISFKADYYFRKPGINYGDVFQGLNFHGDYRTRWQKPGDEVATNVPSMPYPADATRDQFYQYSEVNYEKGDHVRLQDVRLSYNWINAKFKRLPIKNIQFYFYMGNINLMIWKATKSTYDPDFSVFNYPSPRTYSFGLSMNL